MRVVDRAETEAAVTKSRGPTSDVIRRFGCECPTVLVSF